MPYPNRNLQPGQRGPEVSQLQEFLLNQGFLTPDQIATGPGIYGPRTKAAVEKWQQANGVDNASGKGYWGPKSIAAASGLPVNGAGAETQESVDKMYSEAAAKNPVINELTKGGSTVEEIVNAISSGDLSGIVDSVGQPFSAEAQQEALDKAMEDNRLFYEAQQAKDTADTEAKLAKETAAYQDYLINAGQSFQSDKSKLDQQAADAGVLFSGSRVQKEKNLARAYEQEQATKQRTYGSSIADEARGLQYKYGNDAAKGLNQYYNLGGNTFNPNVATGGVGQTSLSSVYDPSKFNFQGTENVTRKANAGIRSAGYLWNKGNKLMKTGYQNKY